MEKSLEVGDMKEAGKYLWNESVPVGLRGMLLLSTRTTETYIVIMLWGRHCVFFYIFESFFCAWIYFF